jgi:hypothetical protein
MHAARKLEVLDAATDIAQLRVPQGNRLEKLTGNRTAGTAFASTGNGASASGVSAAMPSTSS